MIRTDVSQRVRAEAWNARVHMLPGGSLFQTTHWAEYYAAYLGVIPHYLTVREDDAVVGQLLIFETRRGHESVLGAGRPRLARAMDPLLRVFSWRAGPLCGDRQDGAILPECLRVVQQLAIARGVTGVEEGYSPMDGAPDASAHAVFTQYGYRAEARATILIDVRRPVEQLWASLKGQVARTPVRKAQRCGVTVRQVTTEPELRGFYRLISSWRKEQGFQPFSYEKYALMFALLRPHCAFFIAEQGGEVVGGAGIWHCAGRAHLFSPVQSTQARRRQLYVSDLVYWELIRWCHAQGLSLFDLSGVAPTPTSSREAGIRRFKEKWGGTLVEYPAYTAVIKAAPWKLATLMQRTRRKVRAMLVTS